MLFRSKKSRKKSTTTPSTNVLYFFLDFLFVNSMDEYYCCAYPHISASDFASETPFCPDDQRFSVEVAYTNMYVLNAREFETSEYTTHHSFSNISKDEIMQETTIVSWLSSMGVPSEAHRSSSFFF